MDYKCGVFRQWKCHFRFYSCQVCYAICIHFLLFSYFSNFISYHPTPRWNFPELPTAWVKDNTPQISFQIIFTVLFSHFANSTDSVRASLALPLPTPLTMSSVYQSSLSIRTSLERCHQFISPRLSMKRLCTSDYVFLKFYTFLA